MAPPWPPREEIPRTGVDVVAVLDINRSVLSQWKLKILMQAMLIVIGKLGQDDRLSLVSFDDNAHHIMKLTPMSDQGRDIARLVVNKLTGSHRNNMVASLQEGAEILRGREVEEGDNRIGCIMLVSDGDDYHEDLTDDIFSSEFPVHTFGLHNIATFYSVARATWVMKYIADKTSSIYSYVNDDINSIREFFELFVTGITSVAVTCIKITLAAHEGVSISSIEPGGHGNEVSSDQRSGEIHINNIYAGERKSFIVYLTVAEGKKKLLTVGGRYLGFNDSKQLGDMDVFVLRPRSGCSPGKLAINREVAAELVRVQFEKALSAMVEVEYDWSYRWLNEVTLQQVQTEWQELWNKVRCSEEGRAAPAETLLELHKDVAEITRHVAQYEGSNPKEVPYLMSWLTCHRWQRATTKGSRSNSSAFSLAQYGGSGQHAEHEEE